MKDENDGAFTHVDINIKQKEDMSINTDYIELSTTQTYAESLKTLPLNKEQLLDPHRILNESEQSR